MSANRQLYTHQRAGDALVKIREVAAVITKDVGEHSQRVGEISQAGRRSRSFGGDGPWGRSDGRRHGQFAAEFNRVNLPK